MTTSAQSNPPVFEPTAAQQERAAALRRFNLFFVYLPLGLMTLAALTLTGLMLWGALSPNIMGTRAFVSGLSDIVIILTVLPLMLLCAIVPMAAIGLVVYRKQQPKREYGRLQTLFWRLDMLMDKAGDKAETVLPKAADAVISGHSRMAYWRELLDKLTKQFTRR
ncbi:MAG: hypothetical protein GY803_13140 [Chloroflexi bacterium]|nr:hypothetical protein [Chloroflexota bacterium]